VLVEGESDRLAVEMLAKRLGHDLRMERVSIVPMNGATSIVHFLDRYGPRGRVTDCWAYAILARLRPLPGPSCGVA